MASEVGSAFVSLVPSARGFSAAARRELKKALAGVKGEVPIGANVDQADAAAAGRQVTAVAQAAAKDVKVGVKVDRNLVARAFRRAFTSNPEILQALRTGIPAVLSSPVGLAAVAVAGSFALSFVGALAASLLSAGLPAVFLGLGAFLLKDNEQIVSGFTTMVDRIKAAFDGVADSLIGPFLEAMELLGDAAERVAPMVETLMEVFSPAVVPVVEGLIGAIEGFLGALTSDPAALQAMTDTLIEFGVHLPRIGVALGGFFTMLANNENVVKNISAFFSILVFAIDAVGAVINFWAHGFAFWVGMWHRLVDAIGVVVDVISAAPGVISAALSAVGRFFGELPGRIGAVFTAVWATITGFAATLFAWFAALPGRVVGFLASLPGRAAAVFRQMFLLILERIAFGITRALLFVASLPGRLARLFTAALNAAVRAVRAGVSAVVSFFRQLPGRARAALSVLWSRVRSAFSSAVTGARNAARNLVNGFVNIIRNLPSRARREAGKVRDRIVSAFRSAKSWLYQAGRSILTGLANGLKGAIGGAVQAAKDAAAAVLQGVRDALGIGSPSKVFAQQVGRWIPAGIAEGIRLNQRAAQDALDDLTARMSLPARTLAVQGSLPAGAGSDPAPRIVFDVTGADRALATWVRGAVRTKGGGNVQRWGGQRTA